MNKIEIYTTQNVSIEYKLATLKERIFAYLIDFFILVLSIFLFAVITLAIFRSNNLTFLVSALIFFFYSLLFEVFNNGQSIGKAALGIRVVKLTGQNTSLNDYLTRWVFRMIDIYLTIGSAASFLISSSQKNQRLGDLLANTSVIRKKPDYSISLKNLIKRQSPTQYEPKYADARKFKEEDMVLVKTAIERYKKYPNKAHKEALDMLVIKITEKLGIDNRIKDPVIFLETVIKDYVILNR